MTTPTKARYPQVRNLIPNVAARLRDQSFLEEGMAWSAPRDSFKLEKPVGENATSTGVSSTGATQSVSTRTAVYTGNERNGNIFYSLFVMGHLFLGYLISEVWKSCMAAVIILTFQVQAGYLYRWSAVHPVVPDTQAGVVITLPPDATDMFDHASVDVGGYHLPSLTSRGPFSRGSPDLALTPSLEEGDCWVLPHVIGHIGVSLPSPIVMTHATVDHAPMTASNASIRSNAPRNMILWGLVEGFSNLQRYQSHPHIHGLSRSTPAVAVVQASKKINPESFFIELAYLQYHQGDGASVSQTFSVHQDVINASLDYGVVVLEVRGNWGGDHTCLYHLGIHGKKVEL